MFHKSYLWVLLVAFASVACWQAAKSSAAVSDEDAELYRLFVDVVEHVDRSYVKKVERRKLVENAIRGMLEELDPYSDFVTRENRIQLERTTSGHFGGIGVQVDIRGSEVRVVSPMVGTPAYDAGILAGDRIVKVNGEPIERIAVDDIVSKISGPPGTQVTVTVQHAPYDKNPPRDVTMTREIINMEIVRGWERKADDSWDYLIDPAKNIAYVRLTGFSQSSAEDLEKVLDTLKKEKKLNGLILDLRNNPGGLLPAAIKTCDLFVKSGKIVSTKGRGQTSERVFNATEAGTLPDFPMAVLINRFSASASEIVSACLQDHKRAIIVGERSWGKGSVQNVIDLEDGKSAIKLTVASYNRPNGHNIHKFQDMTDKDEWGVSPDKDFELKWTQEQLNKYFAWRGDHDFVKGKGSKEAPKKKSDGGEFEDSQLKLALEYIRGKLGS